MILSNSNVYGQEHGVTREQFSGMLGDINKVQRELLDLSADSAQKLKVLIDKIIAIAGVPDTRVVNKEIQASLYQ